MDASRVRVQPGHLLGALGEVAGGVERLERDPGDGRGLDSVVTRRACFELLLPHLVRIAGSNLHESELIIRLWTQSPSLRFRDPLPILPRISSAALYGVPSARSCRIKPASSPSATLACWRASSPTTSAVSSLSLFSTSSRARPLDSR